MFWPEIGSGLGEPGGTSLPRIPGGSQPDSPEEFYNRNSIIRIEQEMNTRRGKKGCDKSKRKSQHIATLLRK